MLAAPRLAEEASGIGALGIDPWSLLAYLVTFGLLVALLYTLAYKRILGVLDARSGRIRDSLEEADRVRREAQEQQEAMQRTLLEGREEGEQVRSEFASLAVSAAERIIHRSLDPDAHRDLIDEVLAEGDARAGRN